jgi:fermentation-respiration switch protein FrsA (DUF1100 family)
MITLLVGCMSLDGMVIPGDPKAAYDWTGLDVPLELVEEVRFPSGDGVELAGVWFHQPEPRPPLIWLHGNGGALDTYNDRTTFYWAWGDWDVFGVEYRGFGTSDGEPTRDGILEEDGLAAVAWVAEQTGVDPADIPWVALSLGGAVAIHTADEIANGGMLLESTLSGTAPLVDAAAGLDLPTGWFFADEWDNTGAIADILSPVFLVHGQADDFIDSQASVDLFLAAPEPRFIWRPEGVNHTDVIELMPEAFTTRARSFFADPQRGP